MLVPWKASYMENEHLEPKVMKVDGSFRCLVPTTQKMEIIRVPESGYNPSYPFFSAIYKGPITPFVGSSRSFSGLQGGKLNGDLASS